MNKSWKREIKINCRCPHCGFGDEKAKMVSFVEGPETPIDGEFVLCWGCGELMEIDATNVKEVKFRACKPERLALLSESDRAAWQKAKELILMRDGAKETMGHA